jgi:alpha-tubulin suppressor-like RCC1 family protein
VTVRSGLLPSARPHPALRSIRQLLEETAMHRIALALFAVAPAIIIAGCDDPPLTCGIYTYDPDLMTCVCPEGTTLLADGTCLWPDGRVPSVDGSMPRVDAGPIEPPQDAAMDSQLSVDDAGIETDGCITRTFYRDDDNDSFGSATDSVDACVAPEGYVDNSADCDDGCTTCNPSAAETCNGVDDNCNDFTDEGVLTTFFVDADGDAFGDPTSPMEACSMPVGYTANDDDCDDSCTDCRPGGIELCEGSLDEDCSMGVDDGCGCTIGATRACPGGSDVGECAAGTQTCTSAGEWSACRSATPPSTELCNGRDDDCDSIVDGTVAASSCSATRVTGAGCSAGTCVVTSCASGYANCDSAFATGCEARLGTAAHCGSCGDACGWGCDGSSCNDGVSISGGDTHTCAVREDGAVACWGRNHEGQLGDGSLSNRLAPVSVSGLADVIAVSPGARHTCALRSSGRVSCWGSNANGFLGSEVGSRSLIPVGVPGITTAVSVASGETHTCAVLGDGTIRCWGENAFGQLGNGGGSLTSTAPVMVSGISTATAVATRGLTTCAITSGNVRCWGIGSLGDGSTMGSTTPVTVSGLSGVTAITAGYGFECALRPSAVSCWGTGSDGQLGNGASSTSTTPVTVSGLTDAIAIAAGQAHACALRAGGTVQCWGRNTDGQLGDGTTTNRSTPVNVAGLSGVAAIGVGYSYSCAVLSSGAVRCWGKNEYGMLGDGTSTTRTTPVAVSAP